MLDGIGYYKEVMKNNPEQILEFSDWMGIPIEPYRVTLDRLISLLSDEISLAARAFGDNAGLQESGGVEGQTSKLAFRGRLSSGGRRR